MKPAPGEQQGHWCARITLKDGATPRVHLNPSVKSAYTKLRAKERAREISDEARAKGLTAKDFPSLRRPTPVVVSADMQTWVTDWLAERARKGLGAVRENRSHWQHHLEPVLGTKHIKDWTPVDLRGLVHVLDQKIESGEMKWKTAHNIWATCSRMCRDAAFSKLETLRVREQNPAIGVSPPERGVRTSKQYLFPSEFLTFVSCERVPLQWRRAAALSIYLYTRAGELRALQWEDVDFQHGTVHIHRATDRVTKLAKSTKGAQGRRFSIEPALLPLLKAMHRDAGGKGKVTSLFSDRDMARGLRLWLHKANVRRGRTPRQHPDPKEHQLPRPARDRVHVDGGAGGRGPPHPVPRGAHELRHHAALHQAGGGYPGRLRGSLPPSADAPEAGPIGPPLVQEAKPALTAFAGENLRRGRDSNPRRSFSPAPA